MELFIMTTLSEQSPHLYHYTTWQGLQGILNSQRLWAKNIRYLNDTTEYHLAREVLQEKLLPEVTTKIASLVTQNTEALNYVMQNGGIENQGRILVVDMLDSLYQVTGNEFYITSFCGEPLDDYERKNGLLSQWRGYGNQQGFCIVFDTEGLIQNLQRESELHSYDISHISDVVYSHQRDLIQSELGESLDELVKFNIEMLDNIFKKGTPLTGANAMKAFVYITTRFKHRGFHEEREIRIVAALLLHTAQLVEQLASKNLQLKPEKEVLFRESNGLIFPYIELFGKEVGPLPIKKIIVGPGRSKKSAELVLKKMLRKLPIEILVSELPFI
jgi:Protein of unknown function (DUF2971)